MYQKSKVREGNTQKGGAPDGENSLTGGLSKALTAVGREIGVPVFRALLGPSTNTSLYFSFLSHEPVICSISDTPARCAPYFPLFIVFEIDVLFTPELPLHASSCTLTNTS